MASGFLCVALLMQIANLIYSKNRYYDVIENVRNDEPKLGILVGNVSDVVGLGSTTKLGTVCKGIWGYLLLLFDNEIAASS